MRYTSILIFTRMQIKFPLAFFVSIMGAICPTHFIFLNLVTLTTDCLTITSFPVAQHSYSGLDFLNIEVSRTYSDTPHSVGLLWTKDRPSQRPLRNNKQHYQQTDIRTRNPSKRKAADPHLRPRGQQGRHLTTNTNHKILHCIFSAFL